VVAAVVTSVSGASVPARWTQFRGPHHGVVDDDPALPDSWSATENVAWKTGVPGRGWSSPIVWDDHVFVTSVLSDEPPPKPGQDIIEDDMNATYAGGMREAIRH